MAWTKWIFGGLGWAMGGPIGGILGFAMGAALDSKALQQGASGGLSQPGDFAASLMVLCAAVMKSDEKILKSELEFVKQFFARQFGDEKAKELILLLSGTLKKYNGSTIITIPVFGDSTLNL